MSRNAAEHEKNAVRPHSQIARIVVSAVTTCSLLLSSGLQSAQAGAPPETNSAQVRIGTKHVSHPKICHWSIQAVKEWGAKNGEPEEESPESSPPPYSLDESPAKQNPESVPTQAHPVTFHNATHVKLYIYYFVQSGGTVDCKDYTYGGEMAPDGFSKPFVIPAKQTVQFIFHRARKSCPRGRNNPEYALTGGFSADETIDVGFP